MKGKETKDINEWQKEKARIRKELEKKNRELEIEAALGKVRKLTMVMKRPDDLSDIILAVYRELRRLDMALTRTLIWLFSEDPDMFEVWLADTEADNAPFVMKQQVEHPYHKRMFNAWKKRKSKWIYVNEGEGKKDLDDYLFNRTAAAAIPEEVKAGIRSVDKIVNSFSFHNFGCLQADGAKELSKENFEILYRFAREFDLAYTRFLDLQKAEAQAREAEIQLALERVRVRTMAMHRSEELSDTASIMFQELKKLGINSIRSGVCIFNFDNDSAELWMATESGDKTETKVLGTVTGAMHPIYRQWIEAGLQNKQVVRFELSGDDLINYYKVANAQLNLPKRTDNTKYEVYYGFIFPGGSINIISLTTLTNEECEIGNRFANVFGQLYRRFLDLQKAEAQAREAQIEAALERVRSRSIAMHKSEEIADIAGKIFSELRQLDLVLNRVLIWTFNDTEKYTTWWSSNPEVESTAESYRIDYNDNPVFINYLKAWQQRKPIYLFTLSGDTKKSWEDHLFEHTEMSRLPMAVRKGMRAEGTLYTVSVISDYGLMMSGSFEPLSEVNIDIIQRFGRVFQQSYTRYMDVQKAEAQAREGEIQLALERVRAQTMAMHSSKDIGDCILKMFGELTSLGVDEGTRFGIGILNHDNENNQLWTARKEGEEVKMHIGNLDMTSHPLLKSARKAWKEQVPLHKYVLEGDDLLKYYQMINTAPDYKLRVSIEKLPEREFHYGFIFDHGFFYAFSLSEFQQDLIHIAQRFSAVFEQTYRRFLDLQKAEAQAREAEIQLALERVRAKTMAMQSSSELADASLLMANQVRELGIKAWGCAFHIYADNEEGDYEWFSSEQGYLPFYKTPRENVFKRYYDNRQSGESLYIEEFSGDACIKHYEYLMTLPVVGGALRSLRDSGVPLPTSQIDHVVYFSYGYLLFITYEPVPKAYNIFKRFAREFEQTYTRFLDLQKAEAQAREAVKQASLDRVRGEIASMRSKEDLKRITPLVWQELTNLNVSFIRCGVLIMDEVNNVVQTHLSTPDGKTLGIFDLPANSEQIAKGAYASWKEGKIFQEHWDKSKFIRFMQSMIKHGRIDNPESYQGAEAPPESLYLNFLPFKQGMLYVGNTESLSDEDLDLANSLADALSIAYARYEDFRQLEQANDQIQKALDDLQSTQTQLVHAEKMASLGELTAGIAHEIQNPLNFVNNFSEVSKELIFELKAEREKLKDERDESLERELLDDVIQNLDKINHHGQRASSIVKGMLEHSRTGTREKELTDINTLADEYLRLAYHGLRAKDKSFNADFKTELDSSLPKVKVIGQDIGRVLLNLINNAFYAVSQKAKESSSNYKGEVILKTKKHDRNIEIAVKDNGGGIPKNVQDKIFQPFFTTKPTGQGTGLGLSLSYDIITKGHDGHLEMETMEGIGTEFIIQLPVNS